MTKNDGNGKIERITVEIEPDQDAPNPEFHQSLLKKFVALSPQERAVIIELGFGAQNKRWQQAAVEAGYYDD